MGFPNICACGARYWTTIRAPAPGAAIILRVRLDYYLDFGIAIRAPALRRITNLPGRYLPNDNYIQVVMIARYST